MLLVALIVGVGLTITVTFVVELQVPDVAVIVNVVVICEVVLFVKVPLTDDPVPLLAIPDSPAGVVLFQLNVVPATLFGLVISI